MTAATRLVDFDPSHLRDQTYATRRRRGLVDLGTLLSLLIVTLYLLPSALVLPQLTALGRPALMIGLLLAVVWAVTKAHPQLAMRGPQPIRWAVGFWLAALLLSYAAGQDRGLTELEANSTDRQLIYTAVFCGVALACADGIPNRRRFDDLVRVLAASAAIVAVIGIVQAVLGYDITQFIQLPGFELHHDLVGLQGRAGFDRVASTTGHYIELSAVMAATLPFAIHLTRFGGTPLARQLGLCCALTIAAVIPLTLSRTGLLAVFAMGVTMLPAWPWRTRFNVLAAGSLLLAFAILARPGLVGTIASLFIGLGEDPSIQGRTDDYEIVSEFIAERPWLGRGPGTFVPELYLILDNQWLAEMIQGGVLGVAALAGIHLTAIALCVIVLRRSTTAADRHLAACLLSVQVVAVIGSATFDSFAFTTFATTIALGTGMAGALWRLTHPSRQVRTSGARLGRT